MNTSIRVEFSMVPSNEQTRVGVIAWRLVLARVGNIHVNTYHTCASLKNQEFAPENWSRDDILVHFPGKTGQLCPLWVGFMNLHEINKYKID